MAARTATAKTQPGRGSVRYLFVTPRVRSSERYMGIPISSRLEPTVPIRPGTIVSMKRIPPPTSMLA